MKQPRFFIISAAAMLLITSLAKLFNGFGNARILDLPDPVFLLSYKYVLWIVGAVELAISLICILGRRIALQSALVAWLVTCFLIYRFGLLLVGQTKLCPCLGNLTDALHVTPQTAGVVMQLVLAYLFLGSYGTLWRIWHSKPSAHSASQPPGIDDEPG